MRFEEKQNCCTIRTWSKKVWLHFARYWTATWLPVSDKPSLDDVVVILKVINNRIPDSLWENESRFRSRIHARNWASRDAINYRSFTYRGLIQRGQTTNCVCRNCSSGGCVKCVFNCICWGVAPPPPPSLSISYLDSNKDIWNRSPQLFYILKMKICQDQCWIYCLLGRRKKGVGEGEGEKRERGEKVRERLL